MFLVFLAPAADRSWDRTERTFVTRPMGFVAFVFRFLIYRTKGHHLCSAYRVEQKYDDGTFASDREREEYILYIRDEAV